MICGRASVGVEDRIERSGGQQISDVGSCGLALGDDVIET